MWMDLSSRPLEMMLIKNLKREEALMSGGCVALAHKQHLTKTPFNMNFRNYTINFRLPAEAIQGEGGCAIIS